MVSVTTTVYDVYGKPQLMEQIDGLVFLYGSNLWPQNWMVDTVPNKTSKYPKMVPGPCLTCWPTKAPGCQQHGVCPPQTLLVWHFGGWEKKRHHPAVLASIVHQLLPPVAQGKATWYARFKWKRLNPALQIVGASGSGELILMDHILDLQLVSGSQPCTNLQIRIFRSPAMMNAYLKISKWMQTPVATSQCWKEVACGHLSIYPEIKGSIEHRASCPSNLK
jgi:hypothetical protein